MVEGFIRIGSRVTSPIIKISHTLTPNDKRLQKIKVIWNSKRAAITKTVTNLSRNRYIQSVTEKTSQIARGAIWVYAGAKTKLQNLGARIIRIKNAVVASNHYKACEDTVRWCSIAVNTVWHGAIYLIQMTWKAVCTVVKCIPRPSIRWRNMRVRLSLDLTPQKRKPNSKKHSIRISPRIRSKDKVFTEKELNKLFKKVCKDFPTTFQHLTDFQKVAFIHIAAHFLPQIENCFYPPPKFKKSILKALKVELKEDVTTLRVLLRNKDLSNEVVCDMVYLLCNEYRLLEIKRAYKKALRKMEGSKRKKVKS